MPELPDIVVYIEALERRILHHKLERVRVSGPYLLRTATPPIQELEGKRVQACGESGSASRWVSTKITGWCCT